MKMKNLALCLLVLLMAAPAVGAKEREKKPFELKRHEFTVTTAIGPGRYYLGGYDYNYRSYDNYWNPNINDAYFRYENYTKEYISGLWSIGYTYNFTKILAIQANAFFEMGWREQFDRDDDAMLFSERDAYISVMPSFKVHWLNRNMVRMYSYFGLGLSYNLNREVEGSSVRNFNTLMTVWQITPFGMTVGKRVYGLVELGIGTYFSGVAFGLGYRF